jgi:T5SS/PEP-CTERM-associated repeat protein
MAGKTIVFNGKGHPGNLLDPKNWAGGVIPGIGDTALIATNVGGPVNGVFSVNNMMLLGTEKIVFQGILNTAGVGACKGLMVCDGATAVFVPGAVLNDGNVMIVGNDAAGTVLAQGTGTAHSVLNTVDGNIGKHTAGVGTVSIDDAIWNNSGRIIVGDKGNGTLGVTHGGAVTVGGDLAVGACTGGVGHVAVGAGSIAVRGSLHIGSTTAMAGNGTFAVGLGGVVTVSGDLGVGATGRLNLAGGSVTDGSVAGGTGSHLAVQAGGSISGFGSIAAIDGAQIWDQGVIQAIGGTLTVNGNIAGTGSMAIGANSTAVITASSLKLAGISFAGSNAGLTLAHGSTIDAPISGFAIGDILSMAGIDAISFNASKGVLTLSQHNALVENLHFTGNFSGEMFTIHQQNGLGVIGLQHS